MLGTIRRSRHICDAGPLVSYSRHVLDGTMKNKRGAHPANCDHHTCQYPKAAPCPPPGQKSPTLTPEFPERLEIHRQALPVRLPLGKSESTFPSTSGLCHVAQSTDPPISHPHPLALAFRRLHHPETHSISRAFLSEFRQGSKNIPPLPAFSGAQFEESADRHQKQLRNFRQPGSVDKLTWQLRRVQGYTTKPGSGTVGPTESGFDQQSRCMTRQTNGTKMSSTGKRVMRKSAPKATNAKGVAFPGGEVLSKSDLTPDYSAPHADVAADTGKETKPDTEVTVIPEVWGRVHSIESFSAVDGPGIRSVIFTQGCLRKCVFCSNPDTWSSLAKCQRMSSKEIAARLRRNKAYYEGGGGVTISGGEAMMQPQFCGAIFKEAHALGITTCIDTAGYGRTNDWAEVLPYTDLVMLCTKAMDPRLYFHMCGIRQKVMLDFAKAVADYNVPMVIRFVLVPGMTDSKEEVEALVKWAKEQPTLVGVDMLPYHRLGVNKWEELGMKYPLEGMEPPPKEVVELWRSYMQSEGIKVIV